VAVRAVRLCRIRRGNADAPQKVLLVGDGLEMRWVAAQRLAAEVVQFEAVWDLSGEMLVGDAVREQGTLRPFGSAAGHDLAVAASGCACPDPASVRTGDDASEYAVDGGGTLSHVVASRFEVARRGRTVVAVWPHPTV
jgi:hypothetical protein